MGSEHGMGRVREGQAYGVPRTESRVKVRMENKKVMDMNKGLDNEHGSRRSRDQCSSTVLHGV